MGVAGHMQRASLLVLPRSPEEAAEGAVTHTSSADSGVRRTLPATWPFIARGVLQYRTKCRSEGVASYQKP